MAKRVKCQFFLTFISPLPVFSTTQPRLRQAQVATQVLGLSLMHTGRLLSPPANNLWVLIDVTLGYALPLTARDPKRSPEGAWLAWNFEEQFCLGEPPTQTKPRIFQGQGAVTRSGAHAVRGASLVTLAGAGGMKSAPDVRQDHAQSWQPSDAWSTCCALLGPSGAQTQVSCKARGLNAL